MSSPLSTLEFTPRGHTGWTTGTLEFGSVSTVVLGPNGSGKTPILKGIAYSLGHPVELPPDIRTHCQTVSLSLNGIARPVQIERQIAQSFEVRVTAEDGKVENFSDQKKYTAWLLDRLAIPPRNLAHRDTGIVAPYMAVLIPMFWVDQDLGWRNLYSPLSTHNFIRDQQDEVARWLLGAPPKHRALDNTAFLAAKQRLDSLTEQVAIKRSTIEALNRELGPDAHDDARDKLVRRRETLLAELDTNSSALDALLKSAASREDRVGEATRVRDAAKFALDGTERRTHELARLGTELKAEVTILETNEVAADAFRALCGNETCQFFRRPEESYGRRLLYLKDQLKDFQTSFSVVEREVESLRSDLAEAEKQLQTAVRAREINVSRMPSAHIVPIIDEITKELSTINFRVERIDNKDREQERFGALVEASLRQEEEVKRLRPTGGGKADHVRLHEIREALISCFQEWLGILRAQNLPERIWFDDDLRLYLGDDRFTENSPFGGSTRTRIVLAYHAAVLEVSLTRDGYHPPFLCLDTPRQHELHHEDLGAFLNHFRQVVSSQKRPVQIIIGATEKDFAASDSYSMVWRPKFETKEGPRFFGTAGTEITPS